MRKGWMLEVLETPGDVSLESRFTLLEAVGTEVTAILRGGQVFESEIGTEAKQMRETTGKAVRIKYMTQKLIQANDSIVLFASPAGGAFPNRDQNVNKTTTISNRQSESEWTQPFPNFPFRKLKRAAIGLKRILPGGSSREDDRDTERKVPNQGQIESDVPMESGLAAEEEEQIQPRDSDVSDTDQDLGTSTSEATACQLGSSLNMELSSPQQGAESEFTISDLLAQGEEYRLYQLTKFYRDRLKEAIEENVERLGIMLTEEGHFSREENEKVTELTEKGNRAESSRLFLSLVMDKGSRARRAMWKSFVTLRTELPKLDRILRQIQERGVVAGIPSHDLLNAPSGVRLKQPVTIRLCYNKLGDSGVKLVSESLRNPQCKIQKLGLWEVGLTDSGAEDLASALSTNPSVTELDLSHNELGDSGVKLVSAALRNLECKIQTLRLWCVGLTDSGAEDLVSALSTNPSLMELDLVFNSLTDRSVPALRRLILTHPRLERIWLGENRFSRTGETELRSLQEPRPGLRVDCEHPRPRDGDILADSPHSPLTPSPL
ncbi:uncharacterized protein [Hemitrygon akajei]|uniref:uncharacterized protein n=1 Tax=Hemitrygon akajei TaxID=2704970 RepID=UPI003BF9E417